MSKPTIAVVMAHFDDFNGAYFSIQHLRINQEPIDEFVIVDNSSESKNAVHSALLGFAGAARIHLIPAPHLDGTSQTRNAAIRAANADIVICMDCHVLLAPGAVQAVIDYFSVVEHQNDILSGPMLMDHLIAAHSPTHFQPQWNDQMWGRWGSIWLTPDNEQFTVLEDTESGACRYQGMAGSLQLPSAPKFNFPMTPYAGHEKKLRELGCKTWVEASPLDATVPIPGMGLGCFAVWRKKWHGFHNAASGFGGEELAVHELYRQRGGQAVCLNAFRWGHRFFRGTNNAAPYPIALWKKIRNNVLWYKLLGLDLGPIRAEFVAKNLMSSAQWERLIADPIVYTDDPHSALPTTWRNSGLPMPANPDSLTLEGLVEWAAATPRDLNAHIPFIAQMASQCSTAAEFSGRRESTIALLPCMGTIHSYNDEADDSLMELAHKVVIRTTTPGITRRLNITRIGVGRSLAQTLPEPVDLLFLDTEHNGERAVAELDFHAANVRRYIVFHDTELFGVKGDNGSGMAIAIEEWIEANPKWFVMYHTVNQYGLTVLGCNPAERPKTHVFIAAPGPGTELGKVLKSLGITLQAQCDCRTKMNQMNEWGSKGCRDNYATIIEWMMESKKRWGIEAGLEAGGVGEKLAMLSAGLKAWEGWKLAASALVSGTVNPVEAVVKLAISRAEAKGF